MDVLFIQVGGDGLVPIIRGGTLMLEHMSRDNLLYALYAFYAENVLFSRYVRYGDNCTTSLVSWVFKPGRPLLGRELMSSKFRGITVGNILGW